MRKLEIDLDVDILFGISEKDLKRLKQIVDASIPSKKVVTEKLDFDALMKYYNTVFSKSMRVVTDKTKANLNKRVKEGYTKLDIQKVIDNGSNDKYHEPTDFKHVTLEFLSRSDIFTRYVSEKDHQLPRNKKLLKQREGHTNH